MATEALERSLVEIVGAPVPEGDSVLTPGAREFVATLVREFRPRLEELLAERIRRRERWSQGEQLSFS